MTTLSGRRVLVLGASGFIGRWVAVRAAEAGANLTLQARDASRLPSAVAALGTVATADLAEPGSAAGLVAGVDPDVVFNLAAYGVSRFEKDDRRHRVINTDLVDALVPALLATRSDWGGCRLIHPGSSLEYGKSAVSLDESAGCAPDTPYGETKLAATDRLWAARDEGLASLVPRSFMVFGAGERPGRLVPSLLEARATSARIALSAGTQARDWAYVEDVSDAFVRLACVDASKVLGRVGPFDTPGINVASGNLLSVRGFVQVLADEMRIGKERLGFGDLDEDAREMRHPEVPTDRCRAALGAALPSDPRPGLSRMRARIEQGWDPLGRYPEGSQDGNV